MKIIPEILTQTDTAVKGYNRLMHTDSRNGVLVRDAGQANFMRWLVPSCNGDLSEPSS